MYDDVLAEPRLDKQLLKCNPIPDHQMFPQMQLCKTQAEMWQLSPTLLHTYLSTPLNTQLQMLFNPWTLLKKLSPATTTHTRLKKFYITTPNIKLKKPLDTTPHIKLWQLSPTTLHHTQLILLEKLSLVTPLI